MFFVDFVGLADYNKYITPIDNCECLGAPCEIITGKIKRTIVRFFSSDTAISKFPLSIQKTWRKAFLKYKKKAEQYGGVCFLFNAHFYWMIQSGLIQYIRENIQNSFIVFHFSDKIQMYKERYKKFPDLSVLKTNSDLLFTYNILDAKEHCLCVHPPVFPSFPILPFDNNYSSDVFFVGKNKGRLPLLIEIYDKCTNEGLQCRFVISDVSQVERIQREGITYNRIPYSEVLKFVRNTKCVINVVQDGAQGITMREYEAFFYNKHLLTDNCYVLKSPLFRDDQVLMLNDAFNSSIKKCIDKPLSSNNLIYSFNQSNYYSWVEMKCAESRLVGTHTVTMV